MNVCTIGSGYVGLVTGACFAEFGYNVTNVDIDSLKIEKLKKGEIPIYEPGLEALVRQGLESKRLGFTTDLSIGIQNAHIIMIAVGTPSNDQGGQADLQYVFQAARQIAHNLKSYAVIVLKSTVPVGTAQKVAQIVQEERPDLKRGIDFDVASNPEFLREGSAISDFMRPDRVVVGVDSQKARDLLTQLYRPLYLIETPMVVTDIATSELIKYASNAFLATKITFINQMANLCEKVGANITQLAKGMGLDGRIGKKFLHASPGYGGSCFPKDTRALVETALENQTSLSLVESVVSFNENRKKDMAHRILQSLHNRYGSSQGKTIGILGITFKPNTDDLREAASLVIVEELKKAGVLLKIYDPLYYKGSPRLSHVPGELQGSQISWQENAYEAAHDSHGLVILTEWNAFRALDLSLLNQKMVDSPPLLFDFRNIYDPLEMKTFFEYYSLGR